MHLGACQLHSQMAIYHVALPVKWWILIGADYRLDHPRPDMVWFPGQQGNVEQLQTSAQTDSDALARLSCYQVSSLREVRKQCRCEHLLRPSFNKLKYKRVIV